MPTQSDKPAGRQLTHKQRKFIEAYLSNGRRASDAYRTAYSTQGSPANVAKAAAKLLKHPQIAPVIESAEERAAEATERVFEKFALTEERIIEELRHIAFYDPRDIFRWTKNGVVLKSSGTISPEAARVITGIVQSSTGIKVTLADKRAALVDLLKYKKGQFDVPAADRDLGNPDAPAAKVTVTIQGGLPDDEPAT